MAGMITDRFLTRKGWRVVSHSLLAGCGAAFLYIIVSGMIAGSGKAGGSPWALSIEILLSLWLIVLGASMAKSELASR